jgi:hypothetical protein
VSPSLKVAEETSGEKIIKIKETHKKEEGRTWFWSSKSRDDAVVLTQSAVGVASIGERRETSVPRRVEHTASDRLIAARSICSWSPF